MDIKEEIKSVKKLIYKEEMISFVLSICFAMNVACVVCLEFTFWTIINAFCAGLMLRRFRPTVKQQFILHSYLKELKKHLNKKEWTTEK
jgi:hypothetical protein